LQPHPGAGFRPRTRELELSLPLSPSVSRVGLASTDRLKGIQAQGSKPAARGARQGSGPGSLAVGLPTRNELMDND